MLTAAQVYYVARVYPERVSVDEAQPVFDADVKDQNSRSYWEAAAEVLNTLASS